MDFDNAGLLAGDPAGEVARALLCLDCTNAAVREAAELGAQLIVTHHPIIFHPAKRVMAGSALYSLVRRGLSIICAHTNLDVSPVGVNQELALALGLRDIQPLSVLSREGETVYALGRVGLLEEELDSEGFVRLVRERLGCVSPRFTPSQRKIKKVALCGGSGGSELEAALAAGADAYLTADVRHDVFLSAMEAGITLVDGGHYETENVVIAPLARRLSGMHPDVEFFVSKKALCPCAGLE